MTGRGETSAGGRSGQARFRGRSRGPSGVTFAKKARACPFCSQTNHTKRIIGVRPDGLFIFEETLRRLQTKIEKRRIPAQDR